MNNNSVFNACMHGSLLFYSVFQMRKCDTLQRAGFSFGVRDWSQILSPLPLSPDGIRLFSSTVGRGWNLDPLSVSYYSSGV